MIIFSLYNKTLKQFYSPLVDQSIAGIKRSIYDVVNDSKDNYIKLAPANYAVYKVGEFDSKTGMIKANDEPVLVVECAELVQRENDDG